MTIDLSQIHTLFLVVLPALVGGVAGLIRQDKFPGWLNDIILYVIIVLVALSQAFLDGKLGGNAIADFMLVGGYCTAFLASNPGKKLVDSVQTVTSVGGKLEPQPPFDLGALANQIAPFLAQELVKLRMASNVPVVSPQAAQSVQQQQPISFSAQAQQPLYGNPGVNNPVSPQPQILTDPSQVYNLQTQQTQVVPGQQPLPQRWIATNTQVPQSRQGG